MVFAGGVIAAFMFSGTAAFVLYQIVYFLNPDERWWGAQIPGLRWSLVTVALMLFVLMLRYKELGPKSPWLAQPAAKWIVLILGMYYFMYLHALNPVAHSRFTIDFTKTIVIIAVAYKLIHSERALHAVMWGYVLGATYIGYLATITGRNAGNRVEGIGMADGTDANDTAMALVPSAAILMYLAWMGSWKIRLVCVVCGALIANGIVLINSRGAFLGAAFGVGLYLLYMLFSRYQKKGQRALAIFTVIVGISGAISIADDQFIERMTTLQNLEDDSSGAGRMEYWFATFQMLGDHPAGLGIIGYQQISGLYIAPENMGRASNKAVHSSWFQLLSELGWPGPILFFFLLLALYRVNRQAKRTLLSEGRTDEYFRVVALEVAALSLFVSASFIDRFRSEIFWWMILFLAAAGNVYYLQYQAKKEKKATKTLKRREARLS